MLGKIHHFPSMFKYETWWNDNSAYTSRLMNAVLVQLLDRTDLPLPVGSERKIVYKKGSPENNPRRSEATDFIIRKASDLPPGEKLTIISTGALTNVASAVMVKPEIAKKIALYWLGQTYDFEKDLWIGEHEFIFFAMQKIWSSILCLIT